MKKEQPKEYRVNYSLRDGSYLVLCFTCAVGLAMRGALVETEVMEDKGEEKKGCQRCFTEGRWVEV